MRSKFTTLAAAACIVCGIEPTATASSRAKGVAPPVATSCPAGTTWQAVADQSPLHRCSGTLESGCSLPDGRKQGLWRTMDRATDCKLPLHETQYKDGRRHGAQISWRNTCVKGKCTAQRIEEGHWVDERRQGKWTTFGDGAAVLSSGTWFAGKRHGPWLEFGKGGKVVALICYQLDKEAWRAESPAMAAAYMANQATPTGAATPKGAPNARPCPTSFVAAQEDGTKTVSDAESKASRLVRNAQSTTIVRLKVLYLRKAAALVPTNKQYRIMLEAAEAELAKGDAAAPPAGD